MSVGSLLRSAREEAGFSVAEISAQTRIRPSVIEDLESDNFVSSGANAYVRGHIRSIAKYIDIDPQELLTMLDQQIGESNRSMIELLEANNATVLRNRSQLKFSPKLVTTAASVVVGVAIIIPTGLALANKVTHKSSPVKSISSVAKLNPSLTSSGKKSAPATTATNEVSRGVVVAARKGISWLSVSDAYGTQLFSGKLSNGASQTFDPTNGLNMTIGNAGAIVVLVNGKDQGAIGALGEVKSLTFAPAQTNG